MQTLTPLLLPQQKDNVSPFDNSTNGFNPMWWEKGFLGRRNPSYLPYSFTNATGEEFARALLRARAGFVDTEDACISLPTDAVAVERTEVRADLRHRRSGFGTRVVRELKALYPDSTLYAISESADDFWRSTGWKFIPRLEGSLAYRPLFVSAPHGGRR